MDFWDRLLNAAKTALKVEVTSAPEADLSDEDIEAIGDEVGGDLRGGPAIPVADAAVAGAVADVATAVGNVATAVGDLPSASDIGDDLRGGAALPVTITGVAAAPLVKGGAVGEDVECVAGDTDYPATGAVAEGTNYLAVFCADDAVKVAMGEPTSATCGVWVPKGQAVTFPVVVSGVAADDTPHVQSPTAGAVVTLTAMQ